MGQGICGHPGMICGCPQWFCHPQMTWDYDNNTGHVHYREVDFYYFNTLPYGISISYIKFDDYLQRHPERFAWITPVISKKNFLKVPCFCCFFFLFYEINIKKKQKKNTRYALN